MAREGIHAVYSHSCYYFYYRCWAAQSMERRTAVSEHARLAPHRIIGSALPVTRALLELELLKQSNLYGRVIERLLAMLGQYLMLSKSLRVLDRG